MEASDVFAQEVSGADDPFAGTDLEDTFGSVGSVEQPGEGTQVNGQGAEPVRTVDREGNDVPDPQPAGDGTTASASEPSPAGERADAGAVPDPLERGAADGAATSHTPSEAPAAAEQRTEDPTSRPASAGPTEATEAVPTPAAASAGAPAEATGPSAGESSSSAEASAPAGEVGPDEDEAPVPDETKDKSGRVTKRRYLIFKVDGPGKLSQVHWYQDAKGALTERTTGAKRQTVYLARGTEDALKFGFLAAGAPRNGIKLVAVAALHFQPKEVKPLPPEPSKTRLTIN